MIAALAECMAARGERAIDAFAPGEPDGEEAWVIQAPAGAFDQNDERRLELALHAVPAAQQSEHRELHAKIQRWSRYGAGDLLIIGSSNATEAGLGLGGAWNVEANLCFVSDGERATKNLFGAILPEAHRVEGAVKYRERQSAEDGIDEPAPSLLFQWAAYRLVSGAGNLTLGLEPAAAAPGDWVVTLKDGTPVIDERRYNALKRPVEFSLELHTKQVPFEVLIRWRQDGRDCQAELPVNAADAVSRTDPEIFAAVDLDSLLETLASELPLWRRLIAVATRQVRRTGDRDRAELDPHKRVDTSAFLMQRMRRISRALEGLCVRLAAPVRSQRALEWRFGGPVSPAKVAGVLAGSMDGPSDKAFLLAELALTVARAARTVQADGVEFEVVRSYFTRAVEDIAQLLPSGEEPAVAAYVERALERSRRLAKQTGSGSNREAAVVS